MPKKLNFLGGMQNFNEHTGEYEPALTGANGKVVKDADGDGKAHEGERDFNDPKERESLKEEAKEFNAPKKHDYSQIFDEDYQRSYGIPKFEDETDIKKLNDIVEKAMEYDGEEGAIDISNNAMERIGELTTFTEEEQDKLASGTGEEIMDILRSKEKKKLTFEGAVKNADDDVLDEKFGKDTPERKLVGAMKGQETKPKGEFKLDKAKYPDVEETPYGFIYNVNGQSITDLEAQARKFGDYKPGSKYGFSATKDGDEVYYESFEDAYNSVKGSKKISYDDFFSSATNKQIVDDYVSDYFDRAKRQGEQANISADQIVEEFKKDWSGFYSEETLPLIKERIQDKIGYPKGTSKEYTQKINKQFDESYKTLKEKYGFTDEQLKSEKVGETIDHVLQVYDNSKFSGGKSKWNEQELKEIHSLLDVLDDKYYNDYYIRLAPRGY